MTPHGRLWLVAIALILGHLVLHVALGFGAEAPDLFTVALLLLGRANGVKWGAGLGLLLGVLEDAFNVLAFGANAVAMTLVGGLAGLARDLFVGETRLFWITLFLVGKWLRDLAFWVLAGEVVRDPFVQSMVVQGGLRALYAAAAGLAALWLAGLWREQER